MSDKVDITDRLCGLYFTEGTPHVMEASHEIRVLREEIARLTALMQAAFIAHPGLYDEIKRVVAHPTLQ